MAQDSNTSPQFSEDEFLARNFDNEYPSYLKLPEGFDYNLFYVDKNRKRLRKMTNRHEVTERDPNTRYIGEDGQEIDYHPGFWWDIVDASPDEEHAYKETRNWRIENKRHQQAIQDRRADEALEAARANGTAPSEDFVIEGVGPAKPTQEPQVETIYSNGVASETPFIWNAQNRFQLRDINRYWATKELNDKYGGAAWGKQVVVPLAIGAGAALGASYALPWLATGASNYVLPWLSTNLAPGSLGGKIIGNVAGFSLANKGVNDLVYKPLTGSNNTYMEDIFQGLGGEKIQNPYLREAARFGVDLFDPLNVVPYERIGNYLGKGVNTLSSAVENGIVDYLTRESTDPNTILAKLEAGMPLSEAENEIASRIAGGGTPVRPSQIVNGRKTYGVQEGLQDRLVARAQELDRATSAELAEMKPALAKGLEAGDPTAKAIKDNIAQIADGEVTFPQTVIATPDEKGVIIPIVNEYGYQPSIDQLITSTGLFPSRTFPNGNRSVPQLIYGVRGIGDASKADLGIITHPRWANPKKVREGKFFIDTTDNPAVATYYTPYGNTRITDDKLADILHNLDYIKSLPANARESVIERVRNFNRLASESYVPKPDNAPKRASRGINGEHIDELGAAINSIIDQTGGNQLGVNLLVGQYNPSWRTFSGNRRAFDNLNIPNNLEAGNRATIRTTDALNTKMSSKSPESEGYIITNIIDTPEFSPMLGNDILFNTKSKNWTLPGYKKGGRIYDKLASRKGKN